MKKETKYSLFTFLTSSSTLICCTLPALLAVIAGNAAVLSLISNFPWLVKLSYYKDWLFIIAGALLVLNGFMLYRKKACPIEAKDYCEPASKIAKIIFIISVFLYLIGLSFSYIIPYVLYGSDAFS